MLRGIGDFQTLSTLLNNNGHLVDAVDKNKRTALLLACVGGHMEVIKTLVEAGADVSLTRREYSLQMNRVCKRCGDSQR